jgi:hypothetical protein
MASKKCLTYGGLKASLAAKLAVPSPPASPPRFSRLTRPGLFICGAEKSESPPSAPGPSRLGLAHYRRQEAASGAGLKGGAA